MFSVRGVWFECFNINNNAYMRSSNLVTLILMINFFNQFKVYLFLKEKESGESSHLSQTFPFFNIRYFCNTNNKFKIKFVLKLKFWK